jgi:hypothetical protein
MKQEKINVLLGEHSNMRTELLEILKMTHTFLFTFLGLILASTGGYIGLLVDKKYLSYMNELVFAVSQIEIIILVYTILLNLGIQSIAAYISYIEMKINSLLGEDIIFWESNISQAYQKDKTHLVTLNMLYLFYVSFFCLLMYLCFTNNDTKDSFNFYFWIQLVEISVVIILTFQIPEHRNKISRRIKSLIS